MSTVRIQNAHKYYNRGKYSELHVMNDVTLELPDRGMVAIFGRSGCGKTTLLNAVGGLDTIASGRIELFGQDIRRDTDTLRNRYIGYIFQNYNLNVTETVYENVAAALRLCGVTDETDIAERVKVALSNVGMDKYAARTPDTLSGGQQQRVAIARALVKNPAIILADEPTGNLDEANTVLVMDILKAISQSHLVLLVTHEEKLVDYYCDRIIEIVDGRIESNRENSGTRDYVRRDKNAIYLGELQRTETDTPGATVSYYGEPVEGLEISLVHVGGKLYLKTNRPDIKFLDEGSEIHLVDGVFTDTPVTEAGDRRGRTVDMTRLTAPLVGKHYGRLYHFKNAFAAAWRENFSKTRKKSNRNLRACLVLLAIVLVFMTAVMGAGLQHYMDQRDRHNDSLFYIPLDPEKDYTALRVAPGENGVDFARIIGGEPLYDAHTLSFSSAAFMTGSMSALTAEAQAQSVDTLKSQTALAGTTELKSPDEILITSAVADDLLESSTVGYIDGYDDLVGLTTGSAGYIPVSTPLRIVGVVPSEAYFYYVTPRTLTDIVLGSNFWLPAAPASDFASIGEVAPGEAVYIFRNYDDDPQYVCPYELGDTVKLLGRSLTVTEVRTLTERDFMNPEDGSVGEFENTNAEFLLSDEDYIALAYSIGPSDTGDTFWTWDYGFLGGEQEYSNHLQVASTDPAATAAHLAAILGEDGYISPDDILAESLAEVRTAAITGVTFILVVLGLMCLCMFFIMRSSFMTRVREVGILRAIGVTRRNLVFRFAVEAGLLILLTMVLGYLGSAWFIGSLAGAPLFSTIFYFPIWLAAGLLLVICAAAMFFGILPALQLLRRTPSEILSKYDI